MRPDTIKYTVQLRFFLTLIRGKMFNRLLLVTYCIGNFSGVMTIKSAKKLVTKFKQNLQK